MTHVTCSFCLRESEREPGTPCPFCAMLPMPDPVAQGCAAAPVQPPPTRVYSGVITDPVAMFLWELEKYVPNGTIQDASQRAMAQLKQNDGAFRGIESFLAEHCNALARAIRGKEKA